MPREIKGKCHICGTVGPLSFEHIPPRKAFNERPVIKAKLEDLIGQGPNEPIRGQIQQRGIGGYTLCPRCNNNTGSWYGKYFVEWCYQGFEIFSRSKGNPYLAYPIYIFPLRVLKQIITMFFSVNGPEFCDRNLELVKFVLNKKEKYLSPKYRFFVYYNISNRLRSSGVCATLNIYTRNIFVFSEINHFPYGYVMTLDSSPPDQRLFEITHFSKFNYNEFTVMHIKLPVLPTHLWIPGDYRTKEEIIKDRIKSEQE